MDSWTHELSWCGFSLSRVMLDRTVNPSSPWLRQGLDLQEHPPSPLLSSPLLFPSSPPLFSSLLSSFHLIYPLFCHLRSLLLSSPLFSSLLFSSLLFSLLFSPQASVILRQGKCILIVQCCYFFFH